MNPFLATDGYKTGHHLMYPKGTTKVYSNFTPRSNKYAPKGADKIVVFGTQMTIKMINDSFDQYFFSLDKDTVCQEIKKEYSAYLGADYDVSHIEALHDLGYLPIKVKALPEGTLCPMGVPVLTIQNTKEEFYWLTNFLETLLSNLLWKPMTSATIALEYRKLLTKYALATDKENVAGVLFQGHDFSMRGMDSLDATMASGLGHAVSFLGSDSLPVIHGARKYYGETGDVVYSVPATEHSVMCAGTKEDEIGTFRNLMNTFPNGILSVVSDTWNLWDVLTKYLPELKDEVMSRDGKLVVRPDSGNPVDIICGLKEITDIGDLDTTKDGAYVINGEAYEWDSYSWGELLKEYGEFCWEKYFQIMNDPDEFCDWSGDVLSKSRIEVTEAERKGVIELLWDTFGGTTNEQGYKVLDSHIGAIYGDSITLERAKEICERLKAKGFASTNIVLGIGSFTYQYNTRDTFGFAMKATYVEVNGEGREIFKDPITDDGTKKSARGLLNVQEFNNKLTLMDMCTPKEEESGLLKVIFEDGEHTNEVNLTEIRNRVNNLVV